MEKYVIPGLFLLSVLAGIFAPYGPAQAVGVAVAATIVILLALELAEGSVRKAADYLRQLWPFR